MGNCAADPLEKVEDWKQSAKAAGLRYVYDNKPGIGRKSASKGFRYMGVDGRPVRDKKTLGRIKALAIPPAWVGVWICPLTNGHLQATGRDARGRKQSRYHAKWREVRDEAKYERMMAFGTALPGIRERVERDLVRPGLGREKVLATIVRLLETTFIRVGNEEYARTNKSYGLTTMRRRHVAIDGATVRLTFKGKSGVQHTIGVKDRRLAGIVKKCHDVPGYELFEWLDADGVGHPVDSAEVNEYLREISGEHFTAKDFRTWAGTVLASVMLAEFEAFETDKQAKTNVVRAIEAVAERLGNTPSVCRKCYVHPAVLDCYLSGGMVETVRQRVTQEVGEPCYALKREERVLMELLEKRLEAAQGLCGLDWSGQF